MTSKIFIYLMAGLLTLTAADGFTGAQSACAAGRQAGTRTRCGAVSYLLPDGFAAAEMPARAGTGADPIYLFTPGAPSATQATVFCLRGNKTDGERFVLTEHSRVTAGSSASRRNLHMTAEENVRKGNLNIRISILEEQSGLRKQMLITGGRAYIPVLEAEVPDGGQHALIIVNGGAYKKLDAEQYKAYVNGAASKILRSIRPDI